MISSIETVLVVDDDTLMREFVVETLTREHIEVVQASNGIQARNLMQQREFDMAFIDIKMPGMSGMELLRWKNEKALPTLTVIVTAFGTVEQAVEAMQLGAIDFLMKPFSPEQVELVLNKAREWVRLNAQNQYLKEELGWTMPKGKLLLGQSEAMRNILSQIERVAASDCTVLISGESGTGKELAARALHQFSQRAKGPWITVNSAALPANLIQSELFGYERGAFTGANRFKMGKIEAANEGTILLDEIGDIAPDVQIALLRFLQEKTIERLGSTESIGLNVRVIAATHRDLKRAVAEGTFREDLYYRLNTLHLQMPPLREREDDIIDLAYCFLEKFLREQNKSKPRDFSIEALRVMRVHNWPGNVRELINRVERAVLFCDDRLIAPKHLDLDRRSNSRQVVTIEEARKRAEHDAIHIAIQHANGNLTRAAKVLGISRASLYRLCKFNVEMNENNQAHRKLRK